MGSAFLHKKSLLDQFKDDYKMVDPIKARRTERQWENPIVRHKREKGVQDWAKSFAGKKHYRKLTRFNAMRSEAYTEKTAWTYLEELGKLEGEESRMDAAEKILKALGCKPGTEGRWYGKDGDEIDIIDVLDNTEWAFAQKVCGQLQEARQAKKIYPKFVQINTQRDFDKYIKPALGKGAGACGLSDIEGMWWEIADGERVPASAKTAREIRDSVSKRPRFIFVSGAGDERGITDMSLAEYAEEMGMTVKEYLNGYSVGSGESKKSEDSLDDFIDRTGQDPNKIGKSGFSGYIPDQYVDCCYEFRTINRNNYKQLPPHPIFFPRDEKNIDSDWCKHTYLTFDDTLKLFDMVPEHALVVQPRQRNGWSYGNVDGDCCTKDAWIKFAKKYLGVSPSKKSETLSYEKGNKNSRGEDAPWVIRDHKGGKVLASFAKKADAEAHLERMQRYSKSESAVSGRAAAIKDAIADAARATGLANKIVMSATNMPKLFIDVYQGGIMGDGINWEVTGNLSVRRFDKQDVKRAWYVDSLEELEKSFEDEFQQLKDGKFGQAPKSESLKKNFRFKKPKSDDDLITISDIVYEINRRNEGQSAAEKIGSRLESLMESASRDLKWNEMSDEECASAMYKVAQPILSKITSEQLEEIFFNPGHDHEYFRDAIEYDEEAEEPEYRADDLYDFSSIRHESLKKALHESRVKKLEAFGRPYREDVILQILDQDNNTYSREDLEGKTVAELEEIYSELINLAAAKSKAVKSYVLAHKGPNDTTYCKNKAGDWTTHIEDAWEGSGPDSFSAEMKRNFANWVGCDVEDLEVVPVEKFEAVGGVSRHEATDAITPRDVQAAARSAWSSSGAKDFKLDIVRLGDHIIIYAKGPNGGDDIGITWHVYIPSELNDYKTPHVEQFADWGSDKHEPERTYDAKDLDDLEDFFLDEFKALQETLDVTKERMGEAAKSYASKPWEVSWWKYSRGKGEDRVDTFSATDDVAALREIVRRGIAVGPVSGEPMRVVPDGAERKELDKKGWDKTDSFNSVEEVLDEIRNSNGAGCDAIYYIKRPDGSYLLDERETYDYETVTGKPLPRGNSEAKGVGKENLRDVIMKITVSEAKAKRVFKKQYPDGLQLELEASEPLYREEPASVYLSLNNSEGQTASEDIRDVLEKSKASYSDIAQEAYRRLRKEVADPFYNMAADAKKLKPEYVADFLAKAPVDTILKEAEAIDQREAAERDAKAARDAERAKAKQAATDAKFKARGKWEILWDSYDDGNRYKKSFSATDDKDALRTILDKWDWCGPISEPAEKICPNKAEQKELIASGDFEDGDWFNSVKAALKFLDEGNGDGCDLVYYIRRPDGSYLFESGIEPESWDN